MKKAYQKPELDLICFELNEDIVTASGEQKDPLDVAGKTFEKAADGILDFLNGLGG